MYILCNIWDVYFFFINVFLMFFFLFFLMDLCILSMSLKVLFIFLKNVGFMMFWVWNLGNKIFLFLIYFSFFVIDVVFLMVVK